MLKEIRVRSVAAMAVGILCLAIFAVGARPRNHQDNVDRTTAKKPLLILQKNQPDSPLTITAVIVDDSPDSRMPTVHFTLINDSGKRIMVYAVKHEAQFSNGTVSGSVVVTLPDAKHALRTGRAPQAEISGIQYPQPPESLTLSVDFVEFVDGTRWGDDTLKTSERVDGVRAGASAERESLMKVLTTDGPEGVLRSLDSIMPEPNQISSRSEQWLDGFRHGVGWIRERVRGKGQNAADIEKELKQPVESTAERR
jgi:hypothetical protein